MDEKVLEVLEGILRELQDLNSGVGMLLQGQGSENVAAEIQDLRAVTSCILSVLEESS